MSATQAFFVDFKAGFQNPYSSKVDEHAGKLQLFNQQDNVKCITVANSSLQSGTQDLPGKAQDRTLCYFFLYYSRNRLSKDIFNDDMHFLLILSYS